MADLSEPRSQVPLPATPAGRAAGFALDVLAGRVELTIALAEERFAASFFEADMPVEDLVAQVRCARELADLVVIDVEVDKVDSVQVLLADRHGARRRLLARCEASAPHRITALFIGDPIEARWTDQRVAGLEGDVCVRRYEGAGPELLLLHGGGCDVTTWDHLVPLLKGRCTAVDLRSHGRSERSTAFTFAGITDDIGRVIDALQLDRPTIVGHSLGGHAGIEFVVRARHEGGFVALDGPSSSSFDDEAEEGADERWRTIARELRGQDIPSLVTRLRGRALFVLCNKFEGRPDQRDLAAAAVAEREEFAEYLTEARPDIEIAWLPTGHMLFHSMPAETADLINHFLSQRAP